MSDLALAQPAAGVDIARAEEQTWVARAREGNLEAFDAIMGRYEGRLIRFLIGLVGDPEVARELCQDTFLAAYQALPRLQGDVHLSAWLHTIALNRARSHHRRRKFRLFLPIEDHEHALAAPTPDPQEVVPLGEQVQRVLARMPHQYVEVLLLQVNGGLSCREIGEVLHCSEGAVKVKLMRARERFRHYYEEEGGA